MFCKKCGAEICNEAVVCVKCGVPTGVAAVTAEDAKKEASIKTKITCGWIGAFVIPIIGLICGLLLLTKGKAGHGIGQIAVSIFMMFFWYGFFQGLNAAG